MGSLNQSSRLSCRMRFGCEVEGGTMLQTKLPGGSSRSDVNGGFSSSLKSSNWSIVRDVMPSALPCFVPFPDAWRPWSNGCENRSSKLTPRMVRRCAGLCSVFLSSSNFSSDSCHACEGPTIKALGQVDCNSSWGSN